VVTLVGSGALQTSEQVGSGGRPSFLSGILVNARSEVRQDRDRDNWEIVT